MTFQQISLLDEPMSKHTSFKTGGNADFFIKPTTTEELISVLRHCRYKNIPFFIMGNGSNLLISDKGYNGAVIQLCSNMSGESADGTKVIAKCGSRLSAVSQFACDLGLSGLEFASGIPGTVGGGISMNAGAYDGDMSQVVDSVTVLTKDLEIKKLTNSQMKFEYRNSLAQKEGLIVLEAVFTLSVGNKDEIKNKMHILNSKRREKQPLEFPSAGSTFKRPKGFFAAKLIEDCGLKGYTVGGAQVSTKHAGFIINYNNATTDDILAVIDHCKKIVYQVTGVLLEQEVKIY